MDDKYFEDEAIVAGEEESDRQDAEDAVQQAVLACGHVSREIMAEAIVEQMAKWVAEDLPGFDEDLAGAIFDAAMTRAVRLKTAARNKRQG